MYFAHFCQMCVLFSWKNGNSISKFHFFINSISITYSEKWKNGIFFDKLMLLT